MPLFSSPKPFPRRSGKTDTTALIMYAGALGLALYIHYSDRIYKRNRDALSRRATQALEMKVLKTRLDRFYARLADGEALDEAEMEEGRSMEKLLRRWVRCVEEDTAREDVDKARGRQRSGWLAWIF